MKPTLIIVLVLSALALIIVGFLNRKTSQGFANSSSPTFTMYYADWCGHCKATKPMFEQFAKSGSVDVNGTPVTLQLISPEKEPEKMKGVQVKGYPTFLYSDSARGVVEYSGPRSPEGFLEFLKEQVAA